MEKINTENKSVESPQIGLDGWLTLLLSNVALIVTGSLTFILILVKVLHTGRNADTEIKKDIDLILVAGMKLENGELNSDYRLRIERSRRLFSTYKCPILIMGGVTGKEARSEAAAGRDYLVARGVLTEKIMLEDMSRNTLENLQNVKSMVKTNEFVNYVLISNRYHLARIQALANGLGLEPLLCAAEEDFSLQMAKWPRLLLEAYYLHWYFTGKIWSTLTNNQHSLGRIR